MRTLVTCGLVALAGCSQDSLGRVERPAVVFEPSAMELGQVRVGRRAETALTMRNIGNMPVVLSGLTLTAGGGADISLIDAGALAGTTLAEAATLEVSAAFAPLALGEQSARVELAYANGLFAYADLRGDGIGCGELLRCSPPAADFAGVPTGSTADLAVVCSNMSASPLSVDSIAVNLPAELTLVSGPLAGDVIASPGDTTLALHYAPLDAGDDRGSISISVDGCPYNLAVSGTGVLSCPTSRSTTPLLKWSWTGSASDPDFKNVLASPLVASLDGVGTQIVMLTAYAGSNNVDEHWPGALRVLNGGDGAEIFSIPLAEHKLEASSTPAIGDLNGDGLPEIVVMQWGDHVRTTLLAFAADGTLFWTSDEFANPLYTTTGTCIIDASSLAIADLDADGAPEVIVGNVVFDHDGHLLWQGSEGAGKHTCGLFSAIADLDGDGLQEVVAGNTAYHHDGSIMWILPAVPDGSVAIADCDSDPQPEIFMVSESTQTFTVANHDGTIITRNASLGLGGSFGTSPVAAGDLDGDGKAEWVLSVHYDIRALSCPGAILWTKSNVDYFSHGGPAVFDFDGDGKSEVVFSDEEKTAIYRGTDGAVISSLPHNAWTNFETPVVADIDRDGHADLLVPFGWGGGSPGLQAWTNDANDWAGAPSMWNQHTYHVTNVNNDGSVPAVQSWPGPNVFRGTAPTCRR